MLLTSTSIGETLNYTEACIPVLHGVKLLEETWQCKIRMGYRCAPGHDGWMLSSPFLRVYKLAKKKNEANIQPFGPSKLG